MSQSAQRWIRCHTGLPLLTAHPVPWAMLPWQMCPHGCCELPPQQAQGKPRGEFLAQSSALAGAQQTPAGHNPGIMKTVLTGSTFGHLDGCYPQRPQVTL